MSTFILKRTDVPDGIEIAVNDSESIVVGRAMPSDFRFRDVTNLSRQHARFTSANGKLEVHDLDSKNGTYINGERVVKGFARVGDFINLGTLEFEVRAMGTGSEASGMSESSIFHPDELLTAARPGRRKLHPGDAFRLLYQVSSELIRVHSQTEFLSLIVDRIREALSADNVFVHLPDARGVIDTRAAISASSRARRGGDSPKISRTLLHRVIREKVAILAEDTSLDSRFRNAGSIIFSGIRSLMAAPLLVDDQLLGVISADIRGAPRKFSREHLELLTALANLLAMGLRQSQLQRKIQEENRIRQRLAQFHSPAVVEEIIRKGGEAPITELDVTVWFCDIHGFTAYSETHTPREVAAYINTFFELGVNAVFEFGGTLDKYLGDGFMAVFGAPFSQPDDAVRAVRAAMKLHRVVARRNAERPHEPPLIIRSGINTGKVIAGDMGAGVRRDYTVIGDTVNVACRIQDEIADVNAIVVGEATAEIVADAVALKPLGTFTLRGKGQRSTAYLVIHEQ